MAAVVTTLIVGLVSVSLQVTAPCAVVAEPNPTIIVTAQRDADAALADCIASRCPPIKDMNASIAATESRFRIGDYRGARKIMDAAVDRNKRFAARYPRGVATLYDVHARVAYHYGDTEDFRRSIYRRAEVLADGLPPADAERLQAASQVGDMLVTIGEYDEADRQYETAIKAAQAAGQPRVAGAAMLRRAWLQHVRGNSKRALRAIDGVLNGPEGARFRLVGTIIRSRISRDAGDPKAVELLVEAVGRQPPGTQPALLFEPPMPVSSVSIAAANATRFRYTAIFSARSSDSGTLLWADVGFWVRNEGRVEDVEVLRSSRTRDWMEPVVASIAGRRYAPMTAGAGEPGRYRLERYTYSGDFGTPIGSFIKRRTGQAKLRRQDATPRAPS